MELKLKDLRSSKNPKAVSKSCKDILRREIHTSIPILICLQ